MHRQGMCIFDRLGHKWWSLADGIPNLRTPSMEAKRSVVHNACDTTDLGLRFYL